jgi:dihydrofolate reductase
MNLNLIVAMTQKGVIGKDNKLPWHLPEDLKYFKEVTMGAPIIMGRKTYDSIGRPLPGRLNIVVTRNENFRPPGVTVVHSFDGALKAAQDAGSQRDPFLIGGAELFQQGMRHCKKLFITWIEKDFPGDAYFPEWPKEEFEQVACVVKEEPFRHHYCIYERV